MRTELVRACAAGALLLGALHAQEGDVLPGEPFERLPEPVRRSLANLDPRVEGWSSEIFAAAAAAQLTAVARFVESNKSDPAAAEQLLPGVFAPDFRARSLADLADTFVDAVFRVRTAPGARAEAETDRAGFLRSLAGLGAGAQEVHARFENLAVNEEGGELVTRALLVVRARVAGKARQMSSWWECRWQSAPVAAEASEAAPPRLASVRVLEQAESEARDRGPLFADCSASVFGANPAWQEQLVPGLASWRARLDTRLGVPLLGHAAGLALADVDGDGREDLYLCQPGGLPNKLFLHRPDGTLIDRSAEAGVDFLDVSRAALLIDLDDDGDRDLVVDAAQRLLLLANDGKARFWLQAALEAPDTASLAAADVDLDGDLDLFACAYASPFDHAPAPAPYHEAVNGKPAKLFENRGDWIFTDATGERGLAGENRHFAYSASFEDYDLDGDPDLYVASAFGRDELYRNEGGKFTAVAAASGTGDGADGTGVSWGDCDGDGRFDLYVSNACSAAGARIAFLERFQAAASAEVRAAYQHRARGNTLQRNRGDGTFEDVTPPSPANVAAGRWTSGALFCDLNGDGWQDLLAPGGFLSQERAGDLGSFFWRQVVAQSPATLAPSADASVRYLAAWVALNKLLRRGHSLAGGERHRAFLNLAGKGFADVSAASGFDLLDDARALALVDWDGDGDQDVFLTNRSTPRVRFLRNDQETGNAHVTLELRGTRVNRDAIGARVELALEGPGGARTLLRGVRAGEGTLAQSSTRLSIGLGPAAGQGAARLGGVRVFWPGGEREDFRGVEAGQAWRLVQGSGRAELLALPMEAALAASSPAPPQVELHARVPLVRPVNLPRMEVVAEDGGVLSLFGLKAGGEGSGTGKPVVLTLFTSTSASCREELDELARHAEELGRAGLAPLALSVEPLAEQARVADFLRERKWPFPWATAAPATLELLDALQGILLDSERRLPLPASFLVDASGALRAFYLGPVTSERLLADRALCELGEGAQFEAAAPFPGRWMFPDLPDDVDFFEEGLRARGLPDAARELARGRMSVVRTAPADLLQDFGRQSAVEGRMDEAEKFFRRALAADPRHFGALFDWAVVLQQQGKLSEARELYGKALALQPEHADAHFNLALVQIGLGDLESAASQLRWLQSHAVADLDGLERALAARRAGK